MRRKNVLKLPQIAKNEAAITDNPDMKRRFFKIAVFWLITWIIANSITIIVEIYFLCTGKWAKAFNYFYDVFCLYGLKALIKREFPHSIESLSYFWDYTAQTILLFIIYELITIGLPLWLWWSQQTSLRAYLLAMSSMVGSPLFFDITTCSGAPVTGCILAMIAFYIGLIISDMALKDYWPHLDMSKFLFWKRPWK